jgi:leucyl-tRNA synthetase
MDNYNHKEIEKKWQDRWANDHVYESKEDPAKDKFYVLDMFPYPSGEGLHVGHPKGYIATDIISRTARMQGFSTLHPMGWDAFGLPAENYAIKNKVHPRQAVEKNVARFKDQLSIIGLDYNWSREINTTDPEYYKWTQWIFLKLLEKGLAYESYEPINWCPSCQTGLANEDLEDGKCERCGSVVEKRPMRQWTLKITEYADRLLNDLELLPKWPAHIKESQRNWIGRSEGAEFDFRITPRPPLTLRGGAEASEAGVIKVFTTRADTLFGVTYVVLSPEHPLISKIKSQISNFAEVEKYIDEAKNKTEIERTDAKKTKTGVELKGVTAINPANGEEVPVWVADYVLGGYGTGAVMAVPAHDERDYAFAQKYNLPIKQVVIPRMIDESNPHREGKETIFRNAVIVIVRDPKTQKYVCLKWKKQPWTTFVMGGIEEGEDAIAAAKREIEEETGYKNVKFIDNFGDAQSEFFAAHKDVNRIAHTRNVLFEQTNEEHSDLSKEESDIHELVWMSLDEIKNTKMTHSEMPLILRGLEQKKGAFIDEGIVINSGEFDYINSSDARTSIAEKFGEKVVRYKLRDWVFSRQRYWGEPIPVIHCEKCGVVPVPEKDLPVRLPEVEHYEPTGTGESPLANITEWVNVACPKCGGKGKRETNTMPQWAGSSWYYLRYTDPKNDRELVSKDRENYWMRDGGVDVYVGGAEHATRHLIYARFWHKFLFDLGVVSTIEPFMELHSVGLVLAEDGRKMSKRYGNVVNPDDVIHLYGADSLRLYEMFMGPFENAIAWKTESLIGVRRFLEKIWRLYSKINDESNSETKADSLLNKTIQKVTEDIKEFKFNTAVSSMMILVNELDTNTRMDSNDTNKISRVTYENLLKLLAPFAPHMTEELWHKLGYSTSIHLEAWPVFDASKIVEDKTVIAVQVNGKVRAEFEVEGEVSEEDVRERAISLPEVKKWIEGKEIKKVIFVKNKLLSLVVR